MLKGINVCVVLVLLSAIVGCSTASKKMPTPSGFLSDYSQMKAHPKKKGLFIYDNPKKMVSDYTKYMIAPVQLEFVKDEKSERIKDKDKAKLTRHFQEYLEEALADADYTLVKKPGPDVLEIRTAITDVVANKILFNLHWSTVLTGLGVGGASFEAELVDSLHGDTISSVIATQNGNRTKYFRGLSKWGHTNAALEGWAEFLIDCLGSDDPK